MHTRRFLSLALVLAASGEARAQTAPPAAAPASPPPSMPTGASVVLPAVTVTAPRALEAEPTDAASRAARLGRDAEHAADRAAGRDARGGARPDRHPALGRGQSQPVLPARLQPRPRHRPRHLARRHADQHAHPRPRPGLCRRQLPDPRAASTSMLVRKGPYWAEEGDFASAGSLHLAYADRLETQPRARRPAAASATGAGWPPARWRVGHGTLTAAGEIVRYDGPWQVPDAMRKYNGFLRYSEGTADNGFAVTALAYTNSWHSTDQIPQRAVLRRQRSTASAPSTRPTAATPSAIRCRRAGAASDETSRQHDRRLLHLLDPQPLQQLHLLPGQSRPTATSSSRPTSARSWA